MTNNIDPWELLRETRKFVVDAKRLWIEWDNEQEERAVVSMLARIDAALAEHEAEMIEHRKNFARDCKDFDRTMAAWKNG